MTIQGITVLLISSFATAFIFFMMLIKTRQRDRNDSEISASDLIFSSIVSVLIFFLSIAVSLVFIVCSSKSYAHYHTIYSNQLNADVKFVDSDSVEFIGGQPIKSTSEKTTGTLTLSKNDTTVNRDINDVEFVGDVEKDSIVEKIEYSNSTRETKLFGVTLFKMNGWNDLKIHLKKPESKTLKEKQDAQNRKELNSLLDKD